MREDHDEAQDFKKPGGGLINPQGEPMHDDDNKDPTAELSPKGLGKKSPAIKEHP